MSTTAARATLYNYEYPAHKIKLGWNNGDGYHVVTSLPHGWTQSTVCIASVSPTDVSMTVLLDPVDGPYRTNEFTSFDHPIWFDIHVQAHPPKTVDNPTGQACALTAWVGDATRDRVYAGYDLPEEGE